MKNNSLSFTVKMIAAILLLIVSFLIAMLFGAADTTLKDVWHTLSGTQSNETVTMLRELRLPREIAAIFVGAALAVSGAAMQGMTRNPLADPGLIGLTAGAMAAMAIAMAFIPTISYFGIMFACFIGAAAGAAMVFGLGTIKKGGFSPMKLVLAGAAVSAFLHAIAQGIGIYFKISKDVSMWTGGGIIGTTWGQLQVIVPIIAIGLILAILFSRQLTILSLSEEVAVGLGQKTMLIKSLLFIVITLLAGAAVALAGNMVFIGLMIPHIVRSIVGTDYRQIIPLSIIGGAIFMLIADTIGRTIHAPFETSIVAIVAVLGLPFFLYIVNKGGRGI